MAPVKVVKLSARGVADPSLRAVNRGAIAMKKTLSWMKGRLGLGLYGAVKSHADKTDIVAYVHAMTVGAYQVLRNTQDKTSDAECQQAQQARHLLRVCSDDMNELLDNLRQCDAKLPPAPPRGESLEVDYMTSMERAAEAVLAAERSYYAGQAATLKKALGRPDAFARQVQPRDEPSPTQTLGFGQGKVTSPVDVEMTSPPPYVASPEDRREEIPSSNRMDDGPGAVLSPMDVVSEAGEKAHYMDVVSKAYDEMSRMDDEPPLIHEDHQDHLAVAPGAISDRMEVDYDGALQGRSPEPDLMDIDPQTPPGGFQNLLSDFQNRLGGWEHGFQAAGGSAQDARPFWMSGPLSGLSSAAAYPTASAAAMKGSASQQPGERSGLSPTAHFLSRLSLDANTHTQNPTGPSPPVITHRDRRSTFDHPSQDQAFRGRSKDRSRSPKVRPVDSKKRQRSPHVWESPSKRARTSILGSGSLQARRFPDSTRAQSPTPEGRLSRAQHSQGSSGNRSGSPQARLGWPRKTQLPISERYSLPEFGALASAGSSFAAPPPLAGNEPAVSQRPAGIDSHDVDVTMRSPSPQNAGNLPILPPQTPERQDDGGYTPMVISPLDVSHEGVAPVGDMRSDEHIPPSSPRADDTEKEIEGQGQGQGPKEDKGKGRATSPAPSTDSLDSSGDSDLGGSWRENYTLFLEVSAATPDPSKDAGALDALCQLRDELGPMAQMWVNSIRQGLPIEPLMLGFEDFGEANAAAEAVLATGDMLSSLDEFGSQSEIGSWRGTENDGKGTTWGVI